MTADLVSHHLNWSLPPPDCALSDDEVHVWVADIEQNSKLQELAKTLSQSEEERAVRFRFKPDRKKFIAARGVLRSILSRYAKIPAAEIQLDYEPKGKPILANSSQFENLAFNLSHSGGLAVYAITKNRQVGIDLENEQAFSDVDSIAARFFLEEEQAALKFLQSPEKEKMFFRYWTCKEAQLKCSGEGFSAAETKTLFDGRLLELQPAEGYIASLAVRGKPFTLKTWQWLQV
jgi:4'-phosphopantetheinyl transferase